MFKASLFLVLCLSMTCNAWYPANGICAFNMNYNSDYNLAIKHFCPGCTTEQAAIQFSVDVKSLIICHFLKTYPRSIYFSLQRNNHCRINGCLTSGINTVFVANILTFPNWAYVDSWG